MQVICVINFDSVFLPLLNKPRELEAMFRPIILLDSLGIHILIYTTKEKTVVTKLFCEYATSEYFITEQDIVVINKNAKISNKIEVVNHCIEYHNATRSRDLLTQKSLHQQVFVLDDDARFVHYINDKSLFNGIIVDNSSMSHRWLLESFYNSVLQTDKQSHSDQLTALQQMRRAKEAKIEEDQTLLAMQHQKLLYEINSNVMYAIFYLLQKTQYYTWLKMQLMQETVSNQLQHIHANEELPEVNQFVLLVLAQQSAIIAKLQYLYLLQRFHRLEAAKKQEVISLVFQEKNSESFSTYEKFQRLEDLERHNLEDFIAYIYLVACCPNPSAFSSALVKLEIADTLPTLSQFKSLQRSVATKLCLLLEYYNLSVEMHTTTIDLAEYVSFTKEKMEEILNELRYRVANQHLNAIKFSSLCLSALVNIKNYCMEYYNDHIDDYPAVPFKNNEENRYYWLRIQESPESKSINEETKKIAVAACAAVIMSQLQQEMDFHTTSSKTFVELLSLYAAKAEEIRKRIDSYMDELASSHAQIYSANKAMIDESEEKAKTVKQRMMFESTIFQLPTQQQNTPPRKDPFVLCREGNLNALKAALEGLNNFNINQVGDRGKTLLETALQHAHVDIVQWLVKVMNADVNFSQSGYHPIFSAIRGLLQFPKRIDILQTLLDANIEITKRTIDREGYPPLFIAARQGNVRFFSLFLMWGTAKGVINLYGKYPKHTKSKDIQRRTIFEETLLADQNGNRRAIIGTLYSIGICLLPSEIECYIASNLMNTYMLKFIELMLTQQAQKLKPQFMPMSISSPRRNTAGAADIPDTSPRLARTGSFSSLIPFFAAEKIKYPWRGQLAKICASGKPSQLSSRPLDELNKKEDGFTPLHVACIEGNAEMIEFLVNAGVNVYAASKDGLTAIHYLALNDHVKLLDKCVKFESLRKYGIDGSKIDTLPKSLEEINTLGKEGYAPIHAICIRGNRKLLEHLIKLDADLNLISQHGLTALHYTVLFRHAELTKILLQTKKVKLLPDLVDCTALHYAARNNNDSDTMQILLNYCAQEGQLMVAFLLEKCNGESALTKAIMHADKKSAACFFAKGRIFSTSEIEYICMQLQTKENQPEIRKLLFELYAELIKPYQQLGGHITAASPRPIAVPKSPVK